MQEVTIERYLRDQAKKVGGWALKLVCPGVAGVPDRLVLLPGGRLFFVELKAPGKKPTPLQLATHGQLKRLGFQVYVIDSKEQAKDVMHSEFFATQLPGAGY